MRRNKANTSECWRHSRSRRLSIQGNGKSTINKRSSVILFKKNDRQGLHVLARANAYRYFGHGNEVSPVQYEHTSSIYLVM